VVKKIFHCDPKVQIIKKESTKEMEGDHNRPLAQLLGWNVIMIMMMMMMMMMMNNYA
jgi:hypothetical protein